jgi:hypothetical protein
MPLGEQLFSGASIARVTILAPPQSVRSSGETMHEGIPE